MNRLSLAALGAVMALAAPAAAQSPGTNAVSLTFETGVRSGAVMVALYDSESAYAGGPPVAQRRLDATVEAPAAVFDNLPAGDYAAKIFHDVNGDGELNLNPFGVPAEPYAFSNNAIGNMGPASWERARFSVSGAVAQNIRLR